MIISCLQASSISLKILRSAFSGFLIIWLVKQNLTSPLERFDWFRFKREAHVLKLPIDTTLRS